MAAANPVKSVFHQGDSWLDILNTIKSYHLVAENSSGHVVDEIDGTLLGNLTHELSGLLESDKLCARDMVVITFYSLIVLASVFGNSLVCYVVFRFRTMRNTMNSFIANLAVSDLLMTTLNIPFNLARLLLRDWPFGKIMCGMVPFVQVMSVYVSAFTMACIAFHRYKVIVNPLASRLSNYGTVLAFLVGIWVMAALLSLPHAIFNDLVEVFTFKKIIRCQPRYPQPEVPIRRTITLFTFVSQYVLPLLVTGITYGKVVNMVWYRQPVGAMTETQVVSNERSKRKTIKMLIIVVICFAICWLPLNLYHVVQEFDNSRHNTVAFFICHWLAMSSVCYNPFIYSCLNSNFRSAIVGFFTCNSGATSSSSNCSSSLSRNHTSIRSHHSNDSTAPFRQHNAPASASLSRRGSFKVKTNASSFKYRDPRNRKSSKNYTSGAGAKAKETETFL